MRSYSGLDRALGVWDNALSTLGTAPSASRPIPKPAAWAQGSSRGAAALSAEDQRLSGALMRINHVGEVCAQALYQGQALGTQDENERALLLKAAQEETDHLAWCESRLQALGAHKSLLNPLWYLGSFAIGAAAARSGSALGLGFVVETERQVEAHLASHLDQLPAKDDESRAVVEQMRLDEIAHGQAAQAAGAQELPMPLKAGMKLASKLMTSTAYYL